MIDKNRLKKGSSREYDSKGKGMHRMPAFANWLNGAIVPGYAWNQSELSVSLFASALHEGLATSQVFLYSKWKSERTRVLWYLISNGLWWTDTRFALKCIPIETLILCRYKVVTFVSGFCNVCGKAIWVQQRDDFHLQQQLPEVKPWISSSYFTSSSLCSSEAVRAMVCQ